MKLLFVFVLFTILVATESCKKEDSSGTQNPPPPKTSSLKVTLNGMQVVNKFSLQVYSGDTIILTWNYIGSSTFMVLANGVPFSDQHYGDTSLTVTGSLSFNFTVQGVFQAQQVIVTLKPEFPLPVISITADTNVVYDGTATVSWNIQYSNARYLNGEPISAIGSMQLFSLQKDTTLYFSASNLNGASFVYREVIIHVGDPPPPTTLDTLQAGRWYMKVWKIDGQNVPIPDCEKDDYIIFFPDMIYEAHRNTIKCDPKEDELKGRVDYSLYTLNDTLRLAIGGTVHNVKTLDDQNLKIYLNVACPSCPNSISFYEKEYTHQYP
jgi:hypothetical protein